MLALKTLHNFDLQSLPSLPEYARNTVSAFLEDESPVVRTAAVLAVNKLIAA